MKTNWKDLVEFSRFQKYVGGGYILRWDQTWETSDHKEKESVRVCGQRRSAAAVLAGFVP